MTPSEIIARIQGVAELIGPNIYLQALIIALAFVLLGKIADWIISGIIGRFARKSSNNFDDQIIELVHRPVFVSFVLLGLSLATRRIELPDEPTFITLGIIKTIAIFAWYNTILRFLNLASRALSQSKDHKMVQSGMLSLLHNVFKIIVVALTIYFLFLAWNVDVTAWLASDARCGCSETRPTRR